MIAFWGLGTIGKRIISNCLYYDTMPDYIVDSNPELWGETYQDIQIISPDTLGGLEQATVYVTCNKYDEIRTLIKKTNSSIRVCKGDMFWLILRENAQWLKQITFFYESANRSVYQGDKVAFLMDNGLTLGGVESWCIQSGTFLETENNTVNYLIPSDKKNNQKAKGELRSSNIIEYTELYSIVDSVIRKGIDVLVCNFPGMGLDALCVAKMICPSLRTIAVIHNDEEKYYKKYSEAENCIDVCLSISRKTRKSIENRFASVSKIRDLKWSIPVIENLSRSYSSESTPIRIGYAGRIVKEQKRSDLLISVAGILGDKDIDFKMTIVGEGPYYEEMENAIQASPYKDRIDLCHSIARAEIPRFWQEQDICISCSEYEGRSITKAEAMSYGAVPIVTNTSGAEDDIIDGYNGYIIEVGDTKGLAECIIDLYRDREKLRLFGIRAHEMIVKTVSDYNEKAFWEEIINKE